MPISCSALGRPLIIYSHSSDVNVRQVLGAKLPILLTPQSTKLVSPSELILVGLLPVPHPTH